MTNEQVVADNKVVLFHYTLTNDAGDVLDTSEGDEPLAYLQGAGNIVPGLERQMAGRSVGDKFEAVVPPEEGYGVLEGPGPQPLSRGAFPPGVEIEEGMPFMAETEQGMPITLWVTRVEKTQVFVDTNHPLAGETLHFQVEITHIRDANAVELAHGHPHGAHGDEDHH
jgi:FKBP-type peptidyl-prolyl cis-trans isomerase SlyD